MATIAVVALSVLLMHLAARVLDVRRPTIPAFWYGAFLVTIVLPAHHVANGKSPAAAARFLLAVHVALIAVPAGMLLANLWFRFHTREIRSYFSSPVDEPVDERVDDERGRRLFAQALGIAVLVGVSYLAVVHSAPLLDLVRHPGEYRQLVMEREAFVKQAPALPRTLFHVARSVAFPILTMAAAGFFMKSRSRKWLAVFLGTAIVASFFAGLSLAKAPVLSLWLGVLLFAWIYRAGRVRISVVLACLSLAIAFPVIVVLRSAENSVPVGVAARSLEKRVGSDPADILSYYFEAFPGEVGFLHGRSVGKFAWASGSNHFDTANYVYRYIFLKNPGIGTFVPTGTANAAFIGDFYADFGMSGVLMGGILAGVALQGMQIWLLRRRKTIVGMSMYAFLMVTSALVLNNGSLPYFLLSGGALGAIVFGRLLDGSAPRQGVRVRPALSARAGIA